METMMRPLLASMLAGASFALCAADVREIELRRLLAPTQGELAAETAGRIYIYDGLHSSDIDIAMDEEFERVDAMMFIRVKPTNAKGEVRTDPQTGEDLVEEDGC